MTAATFASTSFCATVVPVFGSAWSSSLTILKVTGLPPMTSFSALALSMARATPFSSSLPRWAMEPVSGPAWAMVTVMPAGAAVARSAAGLASSFWPQAARPSASATAKASLVERFIDGVSWNGIGDGPGGAAGVKRGIMRQDSHWALQTTPPRESRREAGFSW